MVGTWAIREGDTKTTQKKCPSHLPGIQPLHMTTRRLIMAQDALGLRYNLNGDVILLVHVLVNEAVMTTESIRKDNEMESKARGVFMEP